MTDNIKSQPGFCYEFFKNQAFWSTRTGVGYNPCSFYSGYIKTDVDPQTAWYGPEHKELIKDIHKGKLIKGCNACYQEEKAGIVSRRMASQDLYENYLQETDIDPQPPTAIDYSVGNLCNLKCTICHPRHSSKWIDDWAQLFPDKNLDHYRFKKNQYITIDDLEYLSNIKIVHFHGGGDPLLSDAHIKLLRNIKHSKGLSDVRVFYNVNATNCVTQEVLELWSECRLVELYFSIDDIGNRFEYQRTGASWEHTVETINWFYNNMPVNHMFKINCTWGYLNIYYLDELINWHQKYFATNRLGDPVDLIFQKCIDTYSLDHIDSAVMNTLLERFEHYPQLKSLLNMLEISTQSHAPFWDIVDRTDKIRGLDYRALCPEWTALIS